VNPKVTIAIADDHRVVRDGLRAILQAESDFEVVGEAGDGIRALDIVDRVKPDVLLLDLVMPGLGGLEVVREIRRRPSATRVVVLSMHADESYVVEALGNGALAYVLKDASSEAVVRAVRESNAGRRYLSPPLSEETIQAYIAMAGRNGPMEPRKRLTDREREVLHLTADGLSSIAVGERLGISARTAESHRRNAMDKLGVHNRVDLVRYALWYGLVPITQPLSPRRGRR
jgi:DNA-binding NarL/FixJ family response regulator